MNKNLSQIKFWLIPSLILTARVFAAIFILSVMGIGLFLFASVVERLMLPWYYIKKRTEAYR